MTAKTSLKLQGHDIENSGYRVRLETEPQSSESVGIQLPPRVAAALIHPAIISRPIAMLLQVNLELSLGALQFPILVPLVK